MLLAKLVFIYMYVYVSFNYYYYCLFLFDRFPSEQQGARSWLPAGSVGQLTVIWSVGKKQNFFSVSPLNVKFSPTDSGMAGRGKLIAVIGDEDTCTGFLLGGIGELNKNRKPNFLVVEKDTSITEIEETFK